MGVLLKIFSSHQANLAREKKENYIFYKIIDSIEDHEKLILQCVNTSSIFNMKISEIVFDIDILYALHPIQACYVGIEYSNSKDYMIALAKNQKTYEAAIKKYTGYRYGKYSIIAQDRKGNIIFSDITTKEEFTMEAQEIAFCEEFISEFDAQQAFHIGLSAGMKITHQKRKTYNLSKPTQPYLRLVK